MASFYDTISTVSIHDNFLILVVSVVRWYDADEIRYSHSQSIEIVLMDSYVRFLKLQDVQTTRFLMDMHFVVLKILRKSPLKPFYRLRVVVSNYISVIPKSDNPNHKDSGVVMDGDGG